LIASDFDEVWKNLAESPVPESATGVIIRRISPDLPHDFFQGYEKISNRRMLLVRVDKREFNQFDQLPEFQGFDISLLKFPDETPENIMVGFSLNDTSYSEIFSALCEDLVCIACKEINQKKMVQYIKERLLLWKQFLNIAGSHGLSPESQRGLYGELRFLRDVMIPNTEIAKAISSWRGPSKANQDFQISDISIEVKTSIAKQHQTIHVANEQQLDDDGLKSLFIYFLSLREKPEHAETLPGIIDEIRKIIELKNGPAYEFETQLFKAGYIDKHRTKYLKPGYHDREIQIFRVDEDFPRIIERDLKAGVGDVKYSIDLSICRKFRVSEEDFISEFEWVNNDYIQ